MIGKCCVKSVNWHITAKCNYNCKFCFSRNLDKEVTSVEKASEVLNSIREMGIEKINFVGGEPTLHPLFFDFIALAKRKGFLVSVVTNGYYLNRERIFKFSPLVDWLGFSIDSADEQVEATLGRGIGGHVQRITELAKIVHEAGIKLKLNTTVTKLNWMEDMRSLMQRLKPDRWKVFQVLRIEGQNDSNFDELSISDDQFNYFKHLNQTTEGISPVFESNRAMIASYFMLSPSGMAMSNLDGSNRTLSSLSNMNDASLPKIMDVQQYLDRGAVYW
jgi:radical S-adenosyl methionine domain-containing protein 2